jgi:hypothetical protein
VYEALSVRLTVYEALRCITDRLLCTFVCVYIHMYIDRSRYICTHPPKDGEGLTIFGNLKSFEGPVLKKL